MIKKILGLGVVGLIFVDNGSSIFPASAKIEPLPNFTYKEQKKSLNAKQIFPNSSHFLTLVDQENSENKARFQKVIQAFNRKLSDRPFGEIMQAIADELIGTPYQEGLLDQTKEEKLVVSLAGFDCVLFVETVLAIARGVAVQDYQYETFVDHIENQRYRDGKLNGYCSRLHYFSDWIADNQKRGNVANITKELGGVNLPKQLNFMSKHKDSYPQLKNSNSTYQCIVDMETNLESLRINYIPRSQVSRIYNRLQPGDIIAIATDIKGLDVTHTGLVYRTSKENIGLIHASPSGSVRIAPDLQTYVDRVEDSVGIIVARPLDSRR